MAKNQKPKHHIVRANKGEIQDEINKLKKAPICVHSSLEQVPEANGRSPYYIVFLDQGDGYYYATYKREVHVCFMTGHLWWRKEVILTTQQVKDEINEARVSLGRQRAHYIATLEWALRGFL